MTRARDMCQLAVGLSWLKRCAIADTATTKGVFFVEEVSSTLVCTVSVCKMALTERRESWDIEAVASIAPIRYKRGASLARRYWRLLL